MEWSIYYIIPFLISLFLTPIIIYLGKKLDAVAKINKRTVHTKPVPRIGGVAIFLAFILSCTLYVKVDSALRAVFIGCFIMFIGGLIDDLVDLKPKYKLAFQIVAALVIIFYGNITLDHFSLPFGIKISMGGIALFITFIWILGISNAVNLIDGLDGLAAGMSAIVLVIMGSLAIIENRSDIAILCFLLVGSILGFLVFNFHPAKIFMGDSGALFLGFIISVISLMGFKSSSFVTLGVPILLLAIPIFDTLVAIIRRKVNNQKISSADKNHLHHILIRKLGHTNAVLLLYVGTLLLGLSAYLYIVNKIVGLILLVIIAICVEIFLEISGMISIEYKPIFNLLKLEYKDRRVYKRK